MAASLGGALFWHGTTYSMTWFVLFGVSCSILLFTGDHKLDKGAPLVLAWFLFVLVSVFILNNDGIGKAIWPALAVMPMYYLSTMREDRKEILRYHIASCGSALVALALYAIFQWIETGTHVSGPLINPNNLAAILNIGLVASVGLAFNKKVWSLGVVLFGLALCATGSRGGIISAAIAISVLLLTIDKRFIVPICSVLLLALFSIDKISIIETINTRLDIWRISYAMAIDNPMGIGLGQYFREFPVYGLKNHHELTMSLVDRGITLGKHFFVHNDPLQFWVEMGIIAPVLFYSMCVQGIMDFIKNPHVVIPFCVFLAVILHTHVSFHLYVPAVGILLGLTLSYWGELSEERHGLS